RVKLGHVSRPLSLQLNGALYGASLNPRRRLQCVQDPTPPKPPPNPARVTRSGHADMAPRDSRSVNRCGHGHLACKFPINVTVRSQRYRFRDAVQILMSGTERLE